MATLAATPALESEEAFPEASSSVSVRNRVSASGCGYVAPVVRVVPLYDTQDVQALVKNLRGTPDYVSTRCPFVFGGQHAVGIEEKWLQVMPKLCLSCDYGFAGRRAFQLEFRRTDFDANGPKNSATLGATPGYADRPDPSLIVHFAEALPMAVISKLSEKSGFAGRRELSQEIYRTDSIDHGLKLTTTLGKVTGETLVGLDVVGTEKNRPRVMSKFCSTISVLAGKFARVGELPPELYRTDFDLVGL